MDCQNANNNLQQKMNYVGMEWHAWLDPEALQSFDQMHSMASGVCAAATQLKRAIHLPLD